MQIPIDERVITDEQLFDAFSLDYPGLESVKASYKNGDLTEAKKCLLHYFETRTNVQYLFDYRKLPLSPVDTDEVPYSFQSALGLSGSLKEFCLDAGKNLLNHIYTIPGRGRGSLNLGKNFETPPHFNFLKDQGKKHRSHLDIFVRGVAFEYLFILYHETGDRSVLQSAEEFLHFFWETYPLIVSNTASDAARFQFDEDRDVMSSGFLALSYVSLLYTRLPYELDPETGFAIIKHLWFMGVQFCRFDHDSYRPYNHHMWERGLIPFILGTMFPEIPAFGGMKRKGAEVICRHVAEDFNEAGGYNEHSIAYWAGAAIGEMLYRGIYLARVNRETLLDNEAAGRLEAAFGILAGITPPGSCYPALGDNRGPEINPILALGVKTLENESCREVLDIRMNGPKNTVHTPLDYCSDQAGFVCGKSGYDGKANYFLMSAKNNCGYSGHNHMDLLSLFLTIHGKPIIDEPDAGRLYHAVRLASPERGFMYNMGSHNTVLAYGSSIAPDCMYADSWGVYRPDTPVTAFVSDPIGTYAKAFHDAYTYCRHTRRLLFHRTAGIVIQDRIDRGNRVPKAHLQRWHLAKGVTAVSLTDTALLLKNEEVRVLCLWDHASSVRIYQEEILYPEIIKDRAELSTVIDVSFYGEKEETLDYAAAVVNAAFLDITGYEESNNSADLAERLKTLTDALSGLMDYEDPHAALLAFDSLLSTH